MTTIALIDKHPIVRTGLGYILKDRFFDIFLLESESVSAFHELFPYEAPDLTILGITQSSVSNNLISINLLKNQNSKGSLIIFDDNPDSSLIVFYLKAHVNGYISKQNNLTELIDCITDVLKGKRYVGKEIMESVIEKLITNKVKPEREIARLTSKQYEIAKYLGEGMSTSCIAQKLGRKMSTISTIKKTIYKKLEVDNILNLREVIQTEYLGNLITKQ